MKINDAMVIKPSPPICIRIRITIWPNKVNITPVFSTVKPVTHTDEVAVNKASTGLRLPLEVVAMGRANKMVPIAITEAKPIINI